MIGGGAVGTSAARVAIGMGAEVTIVDRSLRRIRQLEEYFDGRARGQLTRPAATRSPGPPRLADLTRPRR